MTNQYKNISNTFDLNFIIWVLLHMRVARKNIVDISE